MDHHSGFNNACHCSIKLCLKSKCTFITFFYLTSAFVILIINAVNITPKDITAKMDVQVAFYVSSIALSSVTIPASMYLFINIAKNIHRGFVLHLIIQISWLLISCGYTIHILVRKLSVQGQAGSDVINTVTTVVVLLGLCLFQIWFIKVIFTLYIKWPDQTTRRNALSVNVISADVEEVRRDPPPPSYDIALTLPMTSDQQQLDAANILPSYEEAVKKSKNLKTNSTVAK